MYEYSGMEKAWLVGSATVLDDEPALARILSATFDPSREVVLAEPASVSTSPSVTGEVTWELNEPDERRLRVTTTGPALLVVSENWFPGWVADVDGEATEVRRANLTLQVVEIPSAGEHRVTLHFTAPTVRRALRPSIVASVITIILFGLSYMRGLPAWLPFGRRPG